MKIKQILEGRAEDIDKQIAALRAEKAALGGGRGSMNQSGGEFDPEHDADNARSVRADGTDARVARGTGASGAPGRNYATPVAAGTGASGPPGRNYGRTNVAGASGPPGRNYATPRPGTPRPGTGEHGPAGRYAPRQVAAGTGQHGPANRYQPKPNYANPLRQSGGEFDREHDGDPFLQNLISNAGITKKQAQTLERPIGGGTPKRGDDNPEWYNKGDTKTAKPDLLKWMKSKATPSKTFDRNMDDVNK